MFGMLMLLMVGFYLAYQSEDKAIRISINDFGEANLEAWIILPIVVTMGTLATIIIIKEYKE